MGMETPCPEERRNHECTDRVSPLVEPSPLWQTSGEDRERKEGGREERRRERWRVGGSEEGRRKRREGGRKE